jgi:hypothetical protein
MSNFVAELIFGKLLKPLEGYKTLIGYALLSGGAVVEALASTGVSIPYLKEAAEFIGGGYWAAAIGWTGVGLAHKANHEG